MINGPTKNSCYSISSQTKIIAHIGYPTKTFTAPRILNPCFAELGVNLVVIPISCKACNLDKVFRGLIKVENFFGALITMPHKQSVLPLLDYQSEMVSLSTSCNILKLDNFNKIKGDMFDGAGLINLLYEKKIVIEKKSFLILGSGGVGSAIAFSLALKGVKRIGIYDLDPIKSQRLYQSLSENFPGIDLNIWDKDKAKWEVLINATPVGMDGGAAVPIALGYIQSAELIVDLVLSAHETTFVQLGREYGKMIISGIEILFAQIHEMLKFFGLKTLSKEEVMRLSPF